MKKIKLLLSATLLFVIQSYAKVIKEEKVINKTENPSCGFVAKHILTQADKKYSWPVEFCKLDTGIHKNDTGGKVKVPLFDSVKTSQEPRNFYLAFSTNAFVKTVGGFKQRFSPSFEVGRTYGIFDIGLASGRFSYVKKGADTTRFIELRPTINIFSKGRFSEALCFGAGYVFNAKQGLMTEICNSINFNITEIWTLSILQGYYFMDGTNDNRSTQYMGLNVTYNFLKWHTLNHARKRKALLN
jgi:hypothetical protein